MGCQGKKQQEGKPGTKHFLGVKDTVIYKLVQCTHRMKPVEWK